ncbi:alpha/beta fold hydrolase [Euzebya sp.]|uniref:alpha/beta fold hydrolase n=1 Tax=Euzebya sp. TaxID=1971409 RepID=UPI00351758C9
MQSGSVVIHGRQVAFRVAGDDDPGTPTALLVHGITQDSGTWTPIIDRLASRTRVVAVDLPGHGGSDNPAGDHSMGAYASTLRDLMHLLGRPSATVVGHSLGGGVALQFAYQFPEMVDRLVLVDAGGLGPEVSPLLRAASLPLASPVIAGLARVARAAGRLPGGRGTDLDGIRQGLAGLVDPDARRAFVGTVRATIGPRGQRVSATDKLYLAREVPTLLLWGADDPVIPLAHGRAAHERIAGSEIEVIEGAGHFPHLDEPDRVAARILTFVDATDPSDITSAEWAAVLRAEAEATAGADVQAGATRG